MMPDRFNKNLATIIFSALVFGIISTALSLYSITRMSGFDIRSLAISNNSNITSNTTSQNLTVGQRWDINCSGWNLQAQRKGRINLTLWCESFPGKGGPFTTPGVSPGAQGQQNHTADTDQDNNQQNNANRPTPSQIHPTGSGNESENETENETDNTGRGRGNSITPTQ